MEFGPLWIFLVVLSSLATLANAASLIQGMRFRGFVRRALRMAYGAYLPRVVVLLPVRGLDESFDENLRAILNQSFPTYRIVIISDYPDDPATLRAQALAREVPRVRFDSVVADPGGMGGKVNALRTGLREIVEEDEVVVFADADIRPAHDWLRQLVQPLADVTVGVSTSFRWYVPPRPTFWSLVRSEWNAVSANVLFDPNRNYAWGGSCAIRVETLAPLKLHERWRHVLSDDLVLTAAVRDAGLRIFYSPAALVATEEGASRRGCLDWCLRQMTMAVLYQPHLRRYAASSFAVFDGAVILGIVCLALVSLAGWTFLIPAFLFLFTVPATIAKASLRRDAFFSGAPSVAQRWRVPGWRTAVASLVVPWLMAWGLLRTRRPTTVDWRGRVYDVRDPSHVRLMTTESH